MLHISSLLCRSIVKSILLLFLTKYISHLFCCSTVKFVVLCKITLTLNSVENHAFLYREREHKAMELSFVIPSKSAS